jgi:hypothetical protein
MTNTDTPAVAWYWTDCGIEFFARDGQPHPDHAEPLYRRAPPAPDVRDEIAAILTRAMQDGQGDRDVIALATDDLVELLGGGG